MNRLQGVGFRDAIEPRLVDVARLAELAGLHVLEIGCGSGDEGVALARHGARYMGVDRSESAVLAARATFARAGLPGRFDLWDGYQLPFASGSFDHVRAVGAMATADPPEALVDEIRRVLRPGGTLCVALRNRSRLSRDDLPGRTYDAREAARLFRGFADVEQEVWADRGRWSLLGRWGRHRVVRARKPA